MQSLRIALLAISLLGNAAIAAEVPQNDRLDEYSKLKKWQAEPRYHQDIGVGLPEQILRNFEPRCLSNPACKVALKVTQVQDGFKIEKLFGENDTDADDFYCEQAVWEYAMAADRWIGAQCLCEFSAGTTGLHPELIQNVKPGFVSLHLLPAFFRGSELPGYKKRAESEVINSVVYISKDNLHNPRLTEFRKQWIAFFSSPKPELFDSITKKMDEMKHEFKDLIVTAK
jgi:hypothetical protein